jgi:hypothetical protein
LFGEHTVAKAAVYDAARLCEQAGEGSMMAVAAAQS